MKVKTLLYCTKAKPYLRDYRGKAIFNRFVISPENKPFTSDDKQPILNGTIVAECDCEKVEKWFWNRHWSCYAKNNDIDIQNIDEEDFEKSCLNFGYLYDYLFENDGYAIHLSNLKIFDKPRELNEYYSRPKKVNSFNGPTMVIESIDKAPQNMCKIYDEQENMYVLISVRPEWLCKILNGEKTIEVRRKVLKGMME